MIEILTFVKSGGGFFPLHKLDKHHTAFLVIDKLELLLNTLKNSKRYFNYYCIDITIEFIQRQQMI